MRRGLMIAAALGVACTARDPEPATAQREAPREQPEQAEREEPLVTIELGLVDGEALERLRARLGPSSPVASAEALLAVHHRIAEPWHIYWQNPGDSGLRTRLTLETRAVEAGATLYPAPNPFVALGGQTSYGWDHDAVLFVPLTGLGDDARVELRSDWLACHESCIPGHGEVTVELAELERRTDAITTAMLERLPEPAGDRLRASWTDASLRVEAPADAELRGFFPHASDAAILEAQEFPTTTTSTLRYRFDKPPPADLGQGVVSVVIAGEPRWLELAVPWPSP